MHRAPGRNIPTISQPRPGRSSVCFSLIISFSSPAIIRGLFSGEYFRSHRATPGPALGDTKRDRAERVKKRRQKNVKELLVSGMTEFRCRSLHEGEEEVFDFSFDIAPPIGRDRSLLFAIVSTGHCIRVEGSRSRIEVAAGVLSVSHFLLSIATRYRGQKARFSGPGEYSMCAFACARSRQVSASSNAVPRPRVTISSARARCV